MQNHANKERENIKSIGEIKAKNLEFLVCTCFYIQYRMCVDFFFRCSYRLYGLPSRRKLKAAIEHICSILDVGIYYYKSTSKREIRNKDANRKKRRETRKKNKCLLFINSYKTCICYVQCDAYKVNRSLFHVRSKQEHFCSCFSFFISLV